MGGGCGGLFLGGVGSLGACSCFFGFGFHINLLEVVFDSLVLFFLGVLV